VALDIQIINDKDDVMDVAFLFLAEGDRTGMEPPGYISSEVAVLFQPSACRQPVSPHRLTLRSTRGGFYIV